MAKEDLEEIEELEEEVEETPKKKFVKKTSSGSASVVEVPTQTGPAIQLADETIVDVLGALVYLINQVDEIKKAVA